MRVPIKMTLVTNILETMLIAISFKASFNHACFLARIVSRKPRNKLHKLFVFSELVLVCLTVTDE